jgi:hypothetical protein
MYGAGVVSAVAAFESSGVGEVVGGIALVGVEWVVWGMFVRVGGIIEGLADAA